MYCICCNIEIKPLTLGEENIDIESFIWESIIEKDVDATEIRKTTVNNRMWNDGIVKVISAGYGSSHDTDQFVIAICDNCITKKQEDGTLLYYGNYMESKSKWTNENKENSLKIYRRRRNLDNLL
jgi:hypothetical protein